MSSHWDIVLISTARSHSCDYLWAIVGTPISQFLMKIHVYWVFYLGLRAVVGCPVLRRWEFRVLIWGLQVFNWMVLAYPCTNKAIIWLSQVSKRVNWLVWSLIMAVSRIFRTSKRLISGRTMFWISNWMVFEVSIVLLRISNQVTACLFWTSNQSYWTSVSCFTFPIRLLET